MQNTWALVEQSMCLFMPTPKESGQWATVGDYCIVSNRLYSLPPIGKYPRGE